MKTINITKLFFILAITSLFMGNAQAANFFTPVDTDLSVGILKSLFGGLIPGGGDDPLKNAIGFLNSAVLIIGGILVGYTIFAGTLGTAHEGEMMGKKFSSVWIPIRLSLGTAMVLPLNGGYSLIQHLVMWAVLQGVGLANGVWEAFVSQPISSGQGRVTVTASSQVGNLAEVIFEAHLCTLANKNSFDKIANDSVTGVMATVAKNRMDFGYRLVDNKYEFGNHALNAFVDNSSSCGTISLPELTNYAQSVNSGRFGNTVDVFAIPSVKDIAKAHVTATAKMIADIQPIAQKFIDEVNENKTPSYKKSDLNAAKQAYIEKVQSLGTEFVSNIKPYKAIQERAAADGWLMAGAYFMKLSRLNSSVYSAVNNIAKGEAGRYNANFPGIASNNENIYRTYDGVKSKGSTNASSQMDDTTKNGQKQESGSASGFGGWEKASLLITKTFSSINLQELKNDTRHPLEMVSDIGQRMFTAMAYISGALLGIATVAGLLSAGTATGAILLMGGYVAPLLITMGLIYVFGNIFLPMLPFIIWLGAAIGFFILVVEAIIAAPLWAIMHVHPSGDDMTGKGGSGYMLLLGLLLRPMLMVFGLCSSIVLLKVIGEFINKVFFDVLQFSQDGMGITAILFSTAIYIYVIYYVIMNIFKVIHQIPDELLKWLGGGKEQLGSYSQAMAKGTAAGYAAVAGFSSNQLTNASKGIAQGAAKMLSENPDKKNAALLKSSVDAEMDSKYGAGTSDVVGDSEGVDSGSMKGMSKNISPNSFSAVSKNAITNSLIGKTLDSIKSVAGKNGIEDFKSQFANAKEDGFKAFGGNQNEAIQSIGNDITSNAQAMSSVKKADGEDGLMEYERRMNEAEGSNYSEFGGSKASAAQAISGEIINESADRKLSAFGSEAKTFAKSMSGVIDKPTLANTLSRMTRQVGSNNVDTILKDLNSSNASPESKKAQLQETYAGLKDVNTGTTTENNEPTKNTIKVAESVASELGLNYSEDQKKSFEDTREVINQKYFK